MVESLVIEKNRKLAESQDYARLREKGLEHIRNLSGRIWTDHNSHDPGITTLELLCYALTDLGYRTGFDFKDLLAAESGAPDPPEVSTFFPAHEVLTCTPLTILDYRRLLLKIEGIRNAWLNPMTDPSQVGNYKESEIAIYADCHADELSYQAVNLLGDPNHRVRLSGLYRVLLELEIDDELGSLNQSLLVYQVKRGALKGVVFALDSKDAPFLAGEIDFSQDFAAVQQVDSVVAEGKDFAAEVRVELADSSSIKLQNLKIRVISATPQATAEPIPVTIPELESVLGDSESDSLMALFWAKQQARKKSLDAACCVLDAHRNLGEDFLSVRPVEPEQVAICADVELKSDADIEEVQARLFHEIEKYFNPPVHYYTLTELLDEGFSPDQIFNGPYVDYEFTCRGEKVFTKPGFVKTEDLEASELRRTIYVSDIINILMDFGEIVAIRNVMLRKYDAAGNPIGGSEKWCLEITPNHQPVLFIERSKVLFYKGEIPYRARPAEFQQTLDHLRAMARKAAYVEPNQILPAPRGRFREPEAFYSIQHDYPKTYAIGPAGLPITAEVPRLARARQFKAYLTFYDQVLANYLSQLANLRRLFSLDKTVKQTYFSQYLSSIASVQGAFEDEFYVDKTVLQDTVQRNRLTENEEIFFDRRNRLLDHLTARFAEQFTDYVMLMFDLEGDPLQTGKRLIDEKIDFLAEYPVISRERHKAFNYRPENPAAIWDTDNVSGLEKRVSRLLGIDDYRRRDLACAELFDALFSTRDVGGQFRVEIKRADNSIIFKSQELFPTRESALAEARAIFPFLRLPASYDIDAGGGAGTIFYRINGGGTALRHDAFFDDKAAAVANILEIIDRHDQILQTSQACNDEGFHLFEHILLRPFVDQDELFDVCLSENCEFCGEEDPYSFRITVVLPYWPERFQNLDFRRFFERTLREETPAHIQARICWIGNQQMAELDRRHQAWLHAKSVKDFDQATLTATLRDLIEILQQLKTVYPAATLHDCLEGGGGNLVRLDSTNLGLF